MRPSAAAIAFLVVPALAAGSGSEQSPGLRATVSKKDLPIDIAEVDFEQLTQLYKSASCTPRPRTS